MEPEQTSEATDSYDAAKKRKSGKAHATLDFSSSGSENENPGSENENSGSKSPLVATFNQTRNKSNPQQFDSYRRKPQIPKVSTEVAPLELSPNYELQGQNFFWLFFLQYVTIGRFLI